jgi:hypothetical protein
MGLAGKKHRQYLRRPGSRMETLPDLKPRFRCLDRSPLKPQNHPSGQCLSYRPDRQSPAISSQSPRLTDLRSTSGLGSLFPSFFALFFFVVILRRFGESAHWNVCPYGIQESIRGNIIINNLFGVGMGFGAH